MGSQRDMTERLSLSLHYINVEREKMKLRKNKNKCFIFFFFLAIYNLLFLILGSFVIKSVFKLPCELKS